jgi:hypothetical protein
MNYFANKKIKTMKSLSVIITLLSLSIGFIHAQKPEVVNTIAKEEKPHAFFVKQAELWWKEIEKNRNNEKAWYYYYRANRYARMTFEDCNTPECKKFRYWLDESKYLKEADDIMNLIAKAVPNTYTYYIFYKDGSPDNNERYAALQKAYEIEPENPDTYDELVAYYETQRLTDKRKEINNRWYRSNDLSSGILNYNYNVLMSMRTGGAILTFGDNDTFPLWLLQDVLGIQPDISVLNVSLLTIPEYRKKVFEKLNIPMLDKEYPDGATPENQKEIIDHIITRKPEGLPLYIGTPAWKHFTEYENDLYLTGLVLSYSKENIDNIALLKNNFENSYTLDYINNPFNFDISQSIVNRTNVNYLPGIIKLYQHYALSGDNEKAVKFKKLGMLIADQAGGEWKDKAAEIFK